MNNIYSSSYYRLVISQTLYVCYFQIFQRVSNKSNFLKYPMQVSLIDRFSHYIWLTKWKTLTELIHLYFKCFLLIAFSRVSAQCSNILVNAWWSQILLMHLLRLLLSFRNTWSSLQCKVFFKFSNNASGRVPVHYGHCYIHKYQLVATTCLCTLVTNTRSFSSKSVFNSFNCLFSMISL